MDACKGDKEKGGGIDVDWYKGYGEKKRFS
jgi:hypothetical protein